MKRSKYGNKKTKAQIGDDLIEFDSRAEANRAIHLFKLLEKGLIEKLIFQPSFELQGGFRRNKRAIRAIKYISDFSYVKNGERHIEDVKGVKTSEYQMKKKLFLKQYGDDLRFFEVFYKRNQWEVVEV